MAEFNALTPMQARRWERWLAMDRLRVAADLSLVRAQATAYLARWTEPGALSSNPKTIGERVMRLRRAGDALLAVQRAQAARGLTSLRLKKLFGSWTRP